MISAMTPALELISLPVLVNNYIHILRDHDRKLTIVVDPAEAEPVLALLKQKQWNLTHILITHHHWDHTGGVAALKKQTGCAVIGAAIDKHRLPPLDHEVSEGDHLKIGDLDFEILYLPGHTMGHIAYVSKTPSLAFTGDVLFGMGCGRIFEGTMGEAFSSLQELKSLPPETLVYCTHEYTEKNAEFSCEQFPANDLFKARLLRIRETRKLHKSTVPLLLSEELTTNPFLLAKNTEEFSDLRAKRNRYQTTLLDFALDQ